MLQRCDLAGFRQGERRIARGRRQEYSTSCYSACLKCRKQLAASCLPSSPLLSTDTSVRSPCSPLRESPCSSPLSQTLQILPSIFTLLPFPALPKRAPFFPAEDPGVQKCAFTFPVTALPVISCITPASVELLLKQEPVEKLTAQRQHCSRQLPEHGGGVLGPRC